MARKSVIEARGAWRSPAERARDPKNDIAEAFSSEIDRSFGEIILPAQFGSTFAPEAAGLYVDLREGDITDTKRSGHFMYENYLHRHFWPLIADNDPLLIITGSEGIGKSTLLRFYFDCYLQNLGRFLSVPGAEDNKSLAKQTLRRVVALYADLRRAPTKEAVEAAMFRAFRTEIRQKFEDITTENDYAMWRRRADWADPHHCDAETRYGTRREYRRAFIEDYLKKDDVFVHEALWYLCQRRDEHGQRIYYVTLILDNLDQQDISIQEHVIRIVLAWLGDRIYHVPEGAIDERACVDLWKAILPLRPETLMSLAPLLEPLEKKHVLPLGEVDRTLLLQTRTQKLTAEMESSMKHVESDYLIEEQDTMVYLPLTGHAGAEQMRRMLTFDHFLERGETSPSLKPRPITTEFLQRFCNGSIRRFLRLRKRVGSSIPIFHAIRRMKQRGPEDPFIPHYAFMDSLLTGGRDHFNQDDLNNDVLNLYQCTSLVPCPYTLLIGPHVLYLLKSRNYSRAALIGALMAIGYEDVEVDECLRAMLRKGLIKYTTPQGLGDVPIYRETRVIEAYLSMFTDVPYIDCNTPQKLDRWLS